jgi:hypothetical protein
VPQAAYMQESDKLAVAEEQVQECRASKREIKAAHEKAIADLSFKTDKQIKEEIFQDGILCGGMYALHVIPALPVHYADFYAACKQRADKIEFDKSLLDKK